MEALLRRLVPDFDDKCEGATEQQIAQIEILAGGHLPRFYRWFLLRMGSSMGPFAFHSLDFSAATIISCYAEGIVEIDPDQLLIGFETGPMTDLHMFYDFRYPARDDARVCKGEEGPMFKSFETFREKLAWTCLLVHRVWEHPQQCGGLLTVSTGRLDTLLDPALARFGLQALIPTGVRCNLYEGDQTTMVTSGSISLFNPEGQRHVFSLGGSSATQIRTILGEIASETDIVVDITEWDPPIQ